MKYAHYDKTNGKLLGWYDSEIHSTIPTPNIDVSEADWQTAIDNNYNYVEATTGTLSYKDFRTFQELQQAKIGEIKSAFNQAVSAGYTCSNGITMNSNIDDIDKLQKGYDLSVKNGLSAMDIRDYNNATHTGIALSDVDTMLLELGNNYAALLKHKWDLVDAVNAATTQADLDAVVW